MLSNKKLIFTAPKPVFMNVTTTGATISNIGNDRIATYTSSGTFTINSLGSNVKYGSNIEYLVVAGGGAGGNGVGSYSVTGFGGPSGGGGAGGLLTGSTTALTAQVYTITVGAGGIKGKYKGGSGSNSSIGSAIVAVGGGGGAGADAGPPDVGGSGGGTLGTDPVKGIPGQGNAGGGGFLDDFNGVGGGGGGGALNEGNNANNSMTFYATGGGANIVGIDGTNVYYSGGGAGTSNYLGGIGDQFGTPGGTNTGYGGNGGFDAGGDGGSGIIIIKWKHTNVFDVTPSNSWFTNISVQVLNQINSNTVTVAGLGTGVNVILKFSSTDWLAKGFSSGPGMPQPPYGGIILFVNGVQGYSIYDDHIPKINSITNSITGFPGFYCKVKNADTIYLNFDAGRLAGDVNTINVYNMSDDAKLLNTFTVTRTA